MDRDYLKDWERLFARALRVADTSRRNGQQAVAWSLGGGSALMRRHRHRRSAGVDLFVRDARMLQCVSPRLNAAVGELCGNYVEEAAAVRMYFQEGEVAFIACGLVTSDPLRRESILGRPVLVETSVEILAKKLWHRAAGFSARDLFDFAAVAVFEPNSIRGIDGVLRARRGFLVEHLREHEKALREDFAALHAWQFRPGFEECVATLRTAIARSMPPPVLEQEGCAYEMTARNTISAPREAGVNGRRGRALLASRRSGSEWREASTSSGWRSKAAARPCGEGFSCPPTPL